MIIQKLKIVGLYGYINKEIDFFQDITLIVGINGSGKTSILNILNWILKPSLGHLCVTQFKSLSLTVKIKNIQYTLICTHLKNSFRYEVKTPRKRYQPLKVFIEVSPAEIENDDNQKSILIDEYSKLGPDKNEKETWALLSSFSKPTIIGLDRNIYAEESGGLYVERTTRNEISKKASLRKSAPLDRVKILVNTEYRKKKNAILNLTSKLKNALMLSSFDGSITLASFDSGLKYKLKLQEVEAAEERVSNYLRKFENNTFSKKEQQTVKNYFSQLKEISHKHDYRPKDEITKLLYGLNANQFIKIKKLLREFELFDKKSSLEMEQINNYVTTLNFFFKDSSKEITFKEDTSEITFNSLDKNGTRVALNKDIKFLSSGEQQILILFSYVAFSPFGKVFIIDEPELSLHIKWQEDFLHYLEQIKPKSTQLILATHSPILAGKRRERSRILLPYNK